MGKKTKIGKARKDKFYQLAKEIGYRSRASFKLIQLNRKYEFLQQSRVCIDLCAAPGGWLQVAAQNMPVSSLIVGVDLISIKPIPHTITLQADITTDKCRQALKKELQTWKADIVLNDGAPNVGKNWIHDAFSQAQLTLHALKLATEFLKKGGWFVTKVFRSKDYQPLLWAFQQLFKKVHATKPQASRNESAEIFVVCQGFLAPDKLDSKFTDPKYIFKEVNEDTKNPLNLIHPEKPKRHREGYAEGDTTLYHTLDVSQFINNSNHLELLANCNEIVFDNKDILENPLTTQEVKECCKDVKVLGKKEIRLLLNWRQKLKKEIEPKESKDSQKPEVEDDEDEETKIDKQIQEVKDMESKEIKKKLKKVRREKTKLRQKMDMKMVLPGDRIDTGDDINLFDVKKIKNKKELEEIEMADIELAANNEENNDDEVTLSKKQMMAYDRFEQNEDYFEDDSESEASGNESLQQQESDDGGVSEEEHNSNPLVVNIEDKTDAANRMTSTWFSKKIFKDIENESDEDVDIDRMQQHYVEKGGTIIEKSDGTCQKEAQPTKKGKKKKERMTKECTNSPENIGDKVSNELSVWDTGTVPEDDSDSDSDGHDSDVTDSDYDVDDAISNARKLMLHGDGKNRSKKTKDDFEVVPAEDIAKNFQKLDAAGLAMGAAIAISRKRRREMIEDAYNRYTFNDDHLPDWFVKDEQKHNRALLPVTKEEIQEYKERDKAINARPIKKIAEAKARKKRKAMKRLEKARKKANNVSDNVNSSEKEKWNQIKSIYKKAGLLNKKKEPVTYVVAKRGAGKRASRPPGVKGRYKIVDPRMKKDLRSQQTNNKNKQKQNKGKSARGKKR